MKKKFLFIVLMIGLSDFSSANVCPKVGLGDTREDFEKVYGKPSHGALFYDENTEDMVGYTNDEMMMGFKNKIVYHFVLNNKNNLFSREEVDQLIKDHIPSDSILLDEIPTMINGQTVLIQSWRSEKLKEIFPELKKENPVFSNFHGSISKDMKTGKFTSIVIGLYRKVDEGAIKQAQEAEKERKAEVAKEAEALRKEREAILQHKDTPEEAKRKEEGRKALESLGLG
ncbi:MAG: hypothetical protein JW774_00330 [Candidatus Aureabacteria bacterium]|nr:hypothetical protein [Candidatus Auribacterota bacterium]